MIAMVKHYWGLTGPQFVEFDGELLATPAMPLPRRIWSTLRWCAIEKQWFGFR